MKSEPEATEGEEKASNDAEETIRRQREQIDSQAARIVELEALDAERLALRKRLFQAESELGEVPALRARAGELESPASRVGGGVSAPARRARGVWLPGIRSASKRILDALMRLTRMSR